MWEFLEFKGLISFVILMLYAAVILQLLHTLFFFFNTQYFDMLSIIVDYFLPFYNFFFFGFLKSL